MVRTELTYRATLLTLLIALLVLLHYFIGFPFVRKRDDAWIKKVPNKAFVQNLSRASAGWPADVTVTTPPHPVTIITALYNINRGDTRAGGDGRTVEKYQSWLAETLSIVAPMVVFVGDKRIQEFVNLHRTGHADTHVVLLPFEQLPLYATLNKVKAAQRSEKWVNCGRDPNRLENKLPEYVVLVNSKLQLMAWAAEANPFNSSYFLFLDAGIARWSGAVTQIAGVRNPFPNMTKVHRFDPDGNKFLIQTNLANVKDISIRDWYTFCCGSGAGFLGGVLGGDGPTVRSIFKAHHDMYMNEVLPAQAVANEQMIFAILYSRNESSFAVIPYQCPEPDCVPGRFDGTYSAIDWLA